MAYEFVRATNQYLTATSSVSAVPMTLVCWFNLTDIANAQALVVVNNTSTGDRLQIIAAGNNAGDPIQANATIGATNQQSALSTSGYSANTWHHGAAIFESNSSRTIYLDAANSATNSNTHNVSLGSPLVVVGARNNGTSYALGANGRIAEVGVWNVALNANEIASLARGVTCDKVRPQNLVFYAPLIRDLKDTKGGLIITPNNNPTVVAHPRIYK